MSDKPFYRHQVHEIPAPRIDITEYRLYSGKCAQCGEAVKAQKRSDIPQGIMGPNLMSQIAILAGQYHLSVRINAYWIYYSKSYQNFPIVAGCLQTAQ
ncbi:hypothetical protein BOO24_19065 [Vibrio navarrensis]|nr:hypothetical protein [Vibrio navarrensis]